MTSFRYDAFTLEDGGTRLTCRYSLDGRHFTEIFELLPAARPEGRPQGATTGSVTDLPPAALAAARLVHLLAGVSYYKTAAPLTIDLGGLAPEPAVRALLRCFYVEGLAEFAHRNGIDLSHLELRAGSPRAPGGAGVEAGVAAPTPRAPGRTVAAAVHRAPASPAPRPLIPFGGGMDSIVTAEDVGRRFPGATLLVMEPAGQRFAAIEEPAALTELPVTRVSRRLDPQVLRWRQLGFLNGHVPVTGIISAVGLWAAAVGGHDSVVMSNEWSASLGSMVGNGRTVNHQYSKSLDFERRLREAVAALGGSVEYFSYLRSRSELWVARRFSELTRYHDVFRSCNRAFRIDPAQRLQRWCGTCDKCCFVDLVLAPFMEASRLRSIFDEREPLENPALWGRFETLLGLSPAHKPFECVGDPGECRAAARAAARRPDRASSVQLQRLAAVAEGVPTAATEALLRPLSEHHVPDAFATQDLVV